MRLYGYCEKCRRFRLVRVRYPRRGIQVGICGDCEDKERKRRDTRTT